jgi:hypothetical protein
MEARTVKAALRALDLNPDPSGRPAGERDAADDKN